MENFPPFSTLFHPIFHPIFHPLSIFTMSRTTHSVETMEAMGDAQWDLIACNTFPGLTAAQHSEVVARWRRDKPWGGKFRRCGNKGCAVVLGPAHPTSRCCRAPKSRVGGYGGGHGAPSESMDITLLRQHDEQKDIEDAVRTSTLQPWSSNPPSLHSTWAHSFAQHSLPRR